MTVKRCAQARSSGSGGVPVGLPYTGAALQALTLPVPFSSACPAQPFPLSKRHRQEIPPSEIQRFTAALTPRLTWRSPRVPRGGSWYLGPSVRSLSQSLKTILR